MNVEFLIKVADNLDIKGTKPTTLAANAIGMAVDQSIASEDVYLDSLEKVAQYSTWLDIDEQVQASDILDALLKRAAQYKEVKALPSAKDLYDYKQHREDSLFHHLFEAKVKAEEPDLETMKGGGHPLLTRYSPDYPGVMLYRVSDGVYQDMLSKKVYDFKNGFVSDTGIRYYGGSVALQTPFANQYINSPSISESHHLTIRPR